MSLKYYIF